jgi:CubicO group peptidase (beta-lactamase class C family)
MHPGSMSCRTWHKTCDKRSEFLGRPAFQELRTGVGPRMKYLSPLMRKTPLLTWIAILTIGPVTAENTAAASAQNRTEWIRQVETGLVRRVKIKGQPVQKFTIADRMKHWHVPGASIAVISGGVVAWAEGYGVREPDGAAVSPETLFQAASISKTGSAMTALRLVELGKLSLDEDVNLKLKTWKLPSSEAMQSEKITLRRLLSHTAGTTVHGFPGYAQGDSVPTLPQLLDGVKPANTAAIRVDIKPGTQWRYSGGGYEIVQQLIQDITGKPFADVTKELVLGPLQMTHSTYQQPLAEHLWANAATAYNSEGVAISGKWHVYPEQAAAGLWTTPSDLAKVILEIQKPGRVLTQKTVDLMNTPVLDHYGLGLQLSDTDHQKAFSHGGANDGFRCMLWGYREGGRGVVVMTNGDNGAQLAQEILASVAATYDWPDFKPVEKATVAIPADKVAAYAGTYEAPHNFIIKIVFEDGKLYIQPAGFPRSELLPESEDTFFDPDGAAPDIHFARTSEGNWQLSGGGLNAKWRK